MKLEQLHEDAILEVASFLPFPSFVSFLGTCKKIRNLRHKMISSSQKWNNMTYDEQSLHKRLKKAIYEHDEVFLEFLLFLDVIRHKELDSETRHVGACAAAKSGNKQLVEYFIEKGFNLWEFGLAAAAEGGHKQLVDFFIQKGAEDFDWPIIAASKGGKKDIVEFFLKEGVRPRSVLLAFEHAVEKGHWELTNALLKAVSESNKDPDNNGLLAAARKGQMQMFNFFLDRGKEHWNQTAKRNVLNEALCLAVRWHGRRDIIDLCIREGANSWNAAMFSAARSGNKELVEFFIDKGACQCDEALSSAVEGGHKDLIDFFIQKGAHNWNAAMYSAAQEGSEDLVSYFIKKGANAWNWGLVAASFGKWTRQGFVSNKGLVELFISKGADDWNGALEQAAAGGNFEVTELLVQKGANDWNRALLAATKMMQYKEFAFFIEKGATNLDEAMDEVFHSGSHMEFIGLLLERGASWNNAMKRALEKNCEETINFLVQVKADDLTKRKKRRTEGSAVVTE